jgi:DNA-binding LacI/PurR family transcriptional regulator
MPNVSKPELTYQKIADRADVDPRTVKRVLEGGPTKVRARARIERALLEAGIKPRNGVWPKGKVSR